MGSEAQKQPGSLRTFDAPVYGSDEVIAAMRPTYNLGSAPEPSVDELAAMQKGPYILHARGGKLSRVSAEKTLLPRDPKGAPQGMRAAMAADGTVYFTQQTLQSKSTDGGRTWSTRELTPDASLNRSFQVLKDGTFVAVQGGFEEDQALVVVQTSSDGGETWEKVSEVDNPAACPVRYASFICRLPDDTLILPVQSRYPWNQDPNYVHRFDGRGQDVERTDGYLRRARVFGNPLGWAQHRAGLSWGLLLRDHDSQDGLWQAAGGHPVSRAGSPAMAADRSGRALVLQNGIPGGLGGQGQDVEELAPSDQRARVSAAASLLASAMARWSSHTITAIRPGLQEARPRSAMTKAGHGRTRSTISTSQPNPEG